MPDRLKFYDVRVRKSFTTTDWKKERHGNAVMAVAISPYTGEKCYRIIGRAEARRRKKTGKKKGR